MDAIREADVLLADFTLSSANVYFELGCARGQNKRVIQTARKDTRLDFDVRNWRTIIVQECHRVGGETWLELKAAHDDIMGTSPRRQRPPTSGGERAG